MDHLPSTNQSVKGDNLQNEWLGAGLRIVKAAVVALVCAVASFTASAQDTVPSPIAPWRCYTGREDTGTGNSFVSIDYQMSLSTIESRMPETTDDNGKRLSTVRWDPLPAGVRATGEHIATYRGKEIWRFLYRSDQPGRRAGNVDAVVFAMSLGDAGSVRPFFVLFPDGTESFESFIESSSAVAFSLSADTHMSGTGAFHSSYTFSFPKGIPRFLGRADSGRRLEPKTYR
jgi:hypothetical protein